MATPGTSSLASPIVVLAGGASPETEHRIRSYGPALHVALDGFHGTVISGGTTQGVPAIVGDIGEGTGVRTVGFLPQRLPQGVAPASMLGDTRSCVEPRAMSSQPSSRSSTGPI